MGTCRTRVWGLTALMLLPALAFADGQLQDNEFAVQFGPRGITSVKRVQDTYDTEYISTGGVLGNVAVQYKTPTETTWKMAREIAMVDEPGKAENSIKYSIAAAPTNRSSVKNRSSSIAASSPGRSDLPTRATSHWKSATWPCR